VCEAAKGGQVLVTEEVHGAASDLDGVRYGRMKTRRMKGVKTPVGVCEVSVVPALS
jgi:class 3 adenylate cyclase